MKKVYFREEVKVVGVKNEVVEDGQMSTIDFYICVANQKIYAFTKTFSRQIYKLCKSKISFNKLLTFKSSNKEIMNLVKYAKYLAPYLAKEYDLPTRTRCVSCY